MDKRIHINQPALKRTGGFCRQRSNEISSLDCELTEGASLEVVGEMNFLFRNRDVLDEIAVKCNHFCIQKSFYIYIAVAIVIIRFTSNLLVVTDSPTWYLYSRKFNQKSPKPFQVSFRKLGSFV